MELIDEKLDELGGEEMQEGGEREREGGGEPEGQLEEEETVRRGEGLVSKRLGA